MHIYQQLLTTGLTLSLSSVQTKGIITGLFIGKIADITTGFTTGISTGLTTGITTGITLDLTTGRTTDILTGSTINFFIIITTCLTECYYKGPTLISPQFEINQSNI